MTMDMPEELDLDRMLEDVRKQQQRIEEIQKEVNATTTTGFDTHRLVTVTVKGAGEVSQVQINPDAMRRFDADGLGKLVVEAVTNATTAASSMTRKKFSEVVPEMAEPDAPAADPEDIEELPSWLQ
jgi:nucleoid-associated protein EbfC